MFLEKQENVEEEKMEEIKEEEKVEEPEVVENQENKEEKPKKKTGLIIVLCILFVVVALVAVLANILLGKPKKTEKAEVEKTEVKSTYRLSGNGLEKFDLYFLQLENKEANVVYSPLSIKYALAMLNDGTDGMSHEQIKAVIGDYQPKKYNNNEHMSFANAMFIRDTFNDQIKEEYKRILYDKYNASVIIDPFTNAQPMNQWVSERTFGLVNKMVDDNYVQQANFILTNALAIDMNWNYQIHCTMGQADKVPCLARTYSVNYRHEKLKGEDQEYAKSSPPYQSEDDFPALQFNGKDNYKSAEVFASFNRYDIIKELGEDKIREEVAEAYKKYLDYIKEANVWEYNEVEKDVDKKVTQFIEELAENYGQEAASTDFMINEDDDIKMFAKDLQEYDGTTLQYVGIMPKNQSLSEYIKDIDTQQIIANIDGLKSMKAGAFKDGVVTLIEGKIPMFKYDSELKLEEDLQKLGITDIFDINKSNLSKILKDKKQMIVASHSANIEFSNDGIRAGAVTALGGLGSSRGGFNYLFEVPVERIDITFDKPYMYLIRDKKTGEIWFAGTVYEPVQK